MQINQLLLFLKKLKEVQRNKEYREFLEQQKRLAPNENRNHYPGDDTAQEVSMVVYISEYIYIYIMMFYDLISLMLGGAM